MKRLSLMLLMAISAAAANTTQTPIQHVVFIVKENRSFDNMFGLFPGADGANSCYMADLGKSIPMGHTPDRVRSMGHGWADGHTAIDGGKMDQFDLVQLSNWPIGDPNGDYMTCSQYQESDIPNYYRLAKTFVLADNTFSSIDSGSFPNHLYTVAASSGNPDPANQKTTYAVVNSPPASTAWGCDAPSSVLAEEMRPLDGHIQFVAPCFTFTTLADEMQQAGVSWRYYAPGAKETGYIWSTLDAFTSIRNTGLWTTNVVSYSQFAQDAVSGRLPAVSWLVGTDPVSEHPSASVCEGENWTVREINAIMRGPLWNSTAIFIVWDDFGGFYDHLTPPISDFYGQGIRVPMLIISPYAANGGKGSVTHTVYEFASVLKFIEYNWKDWGLLSLSNRDAKAKNPAADPAAFNFTQNPIPAHKLNPRRCPARGPEGITRPAILSIGNVNVGFQGSKPVQLKNQGTAALDNIVITTSGPPFTETNDCPGSLAVHATCTITVTFTPTQKGRAGGLVYVSDNDTAMPQVTAASGVGQ